MRACEKTTQTVQKYTNFLQCFLVFFFTKVYILNNGRDKTRTFLTKTYLLSPKRRVGDGSVVETHKIDDLVTREIYKNNILENIKEKNVCFFLIFVAKCTRELR